MANANVFNPEVINYKSKNNWAPFLVPESRSCGGFIITSFANMGAEKINC